MDQVTAASMDFLTDTEKGAQKEHDIQVDQHKVVKVNLIDQSDENATIANPKSDIYDAVELDMSVPIDSEILIDRRLKVDLQQIAGKDLQLDLVDDNIESTLEKTPSADQHSLTNASQSSSTPHPAVVSSSTTSTSIYMVAGKRSGLYRLFESEFFTCTLALHYLHRYPDDPGLQYYLCRRLREKSSHHNNLFSSQLESYLPQLCHMALEQQQPVTEILSSSTQPHSPLPSLFYSSPLESFLIEYAEGRVHVACALLWILEGYLKDAVRAGDKRTYTLVTRLLCKVQETVFKQEDYVRIIGSNGIGCGNGCPLDAVNVNALLVGFGCQLATVVLPQLMHQVRPLLLSESHRGHLPNIKLYSSPPNDQDIDEGVGDNPTTSPLSIRSTEERRRRKSLKSSILHMAPFIKRRSSSKVQSPVATTATTTTTTASVANSQSHLSLASSLPSPHLMYSKEMLLASSLVDISKRLVASASSSTKQALNRKLSQELLVLDRDDLPVDACLTLFCGNDQADNEGEDMSMSLFMHDRVIRIAQDEASILNSAERVPYVAYLEVLKRCSQDILEQAKEIKSRLKSSSTFKEEQEVDSSAVTSPCHEDEQSETERLPLQSSVITSPRRSTSINDQMHAAAVMLAQLAAHDQDLPQTTITTIRSRIIADMQRLEQESSEQQGEGGIDNTSQDNIEAQKDFQDAHQQKTASVVQPRSESWISVHKRSLSDVDLISVKDDPSASVLREPWAEKQSRIRQTSPFGHLPGWSLLPVIVKAGVDMRQELLASQLIGEFASIWNDAGMKLWLKPYRVMVVGIEGGLVETITDSVSIHSVKKASTLAAMAESTPTTSNSNTYRDPIWSLKAHYKRSFPRIDDYLKARDAFLYSLVAYSIVCYVLAVRDRHNGNILVDKEGHVVHIDYGFMLGMVPGGSVLGVEGSGGPFKLTQDYLELLLSDEIASLDDNIDDVLDSQQSSIKIPPLWKDFKRLFLEGFLEIRKHADRILTPIQSYEMSLIASSTTSNAIKYPTLPCFVANSPSLIIEGIKARLLLGQSRVEEMVDSLIRQAKNNLFTRLYDMFQYYYNGIY